MRKVWSWMRGYRLFFFIAIFSAIISQVFVSLAPKIIEVAVDGVVSGKPLTGFSGFLLSFLGGAEFLKTKIWILGIAFFIMYLLRCLFTFARTYFAGYAAEGSIKNVKDKMYDRIQRMPYSYQQKMETGDLIQRVSSDTETLKRLMGSQFLELVTSFFLLIFITISMFNMDVRMSLLSLPVFLLAGIISGIFFTKVKSAFTDYDEQEAKLTVKLQESMTNIRVVRAFGTEKREIENFNLENEKLRDLDWKLLNLFPNFWTLLDCMFYIQQGVVLVWGVIFCIRGTLSVGTFIVFISYINTLYFPVIQLGRNLSEIGKAKVSIDRISEVLEMENEDLFPTGEKPEIKGDITFKDVSLKYEDSDNDVLKGLNFHIDAGKTLAIIGPTGSGKSSLVQLLPRLYEYDGGSIVIDGHELKETDKGWIRQNIGLILQEPFLFQKSARENILIANTSATEETLLRVSKDAHIDEDIMRFKMGYDTIIGEKGVSLSGGQRQRMAIARMLACDTPILIFDDSLSAVDTETDAMIRKSLFNKENKKTLIIISHRISTVMDADWIVVIEKGKIIEQGTHRSLIKEEGLYKRLYDIQSLTEVE